MTGLMMLMQRTTAFGTTDDACKTIAAVARELATATLLGKMWTRFRGVVLPLDLNTIELLLTESRPVRAAAPGKTTRVIPLNRLPTGPGEVGQICLTVDSAADSSAKPVAGAGLRATLRLSETTFKSDADTLLRLLGVCFDIALADSGAIGPRAWVKELETGWATATRRTGRDWLPAGSTLAQNRTGSIVIAHREDPASGSAAARDAIARVREALNGSPVQPPAPAPRAAPVVTPPVMPPPPALQPAADLTRTLSAPSLAAPDQPPTNPLPFSSTPSAEFVASFAAPASTTPHPAVGETLPLGANLLASLRPTLPFGHSVPRPAAGPGKRNEVEETLPLGANLLSAILPTLPFNQPARAPGVAVAPAVPLPDLTLDAYASLCAELSVFPATATDIMRKYGVADDRVKRRLDQRWQDLFTTAPPLRDEWQRKTTAFCDWLRRGGR